MFRDRLEAGMMLAQKLKKHCNDAGVVMAVPRGGVPVAYAVAKELGLPLEVVLTKKIGHPANKEYAIGAASLSDYFVAPHDDVSEEYILGEVSKIQSSLKIMYQRYLGGRTPEKMEGKTVIVIDDGIATGNTLLATVNVLRKSKPAKIIIGAPVASKGAIKKLSTEADEVVVVIVPEIFNGVGAFYKDFEEVSDEEVLFYLKNLRDLRMAG